MKPRADGKLVHFRFKEKVLCGTLPGDLGMWPRGHLWIEDPANAAKLVNCPDCLAERARRLSKPK